MASLPQTGKPQSGKPVTDHEGFLRHKRFRWLKIAILVSLIALVGYIAAHDLTAAAGTAIRSA